MKELSTFISIAVLIILLGFIVYTENRRQSTSRVDTISTEEQTELIEIPVQGFIAKSYDLPSAMSFANEAVPLQLTDVRERLDRELQINCYLHSSTLFIMKRANRWLPEIEKILKENGIPEDFKYLPLIESALLNAVSPKEAAGFWQILKSAGREYGLEITDQVDERYDVVKATRVACRYLNDANRKFGNWTMASASYNRGMTGMDKAIKNQKVKSYYELFLNDETSRYVFRMLAMKEIMENPAKYGFSVNTKHLYEQEEVRYVEVKESIKSLVNFSLQQGTNYKTIKRLNPWLRDEALKVKSGKTYKIALPVL
jgi:membrane-bound lytic murein transglycosylase D